MHLAEKACSRGNSFQNWIHFFLSHLQLKPNVQPLKLGKGTPHFLKTVEKSQYCPCAIVTCKKFCMARKRKFIVNRGESIGKESAGKHCALHFSLKHFFFALRVNNSRVGRPPVRIIGRKKARERSISGTKRAQGFSEACTTRIDW